LRRQDAKEPLPREVFTDPIVQLAAVCPICALAALSPDAGMAALAPALWAFNPAINPRAALLAFVYAWPYAGWITPPWAPPRLML
jgi:hypothetical protein